MATVCGADDIHRLIALFRSNEVIVVDKSQGIPQAWRARFQALKKLSVELGGRCKFSNYVVRDSGTYTMLTGCDVL